MPHLQLALSVLLLSTGFGGLTVSIIFWYRTREETLLVVIAETALFALGLIVSISVFYMQEIAQAPVDLGRIARYINGVLVLVLYGGLFLLTRQVTNKSAVAPVLLGLVVCAVYLAFAFVGPSVESVRGWMVRNQSIVTLVSVFAASGFLGTCGRQLLVNAVPPTDVLHQLIRSLGLMLLTFAVLSAVSTAVVVSLDLALEPTGLLNFLLFLGWNGMLISAFVQYLIRPVDLFDGELPTQTVQRYGISPREIDVIRFLSRGLSNKEIAGQMNVSFTTVRTHLYNIFKKTGAASRVELLRILSGK